MIVRLILAKLVEEFELSLFMKGLGVLILLELGVEGATVIGVGLFLGGSKSGAIFQRRIDASDEHDTNTWSLYKVSNCVISWR